MNIYISGHDHVTANKFAADAVAAGHKVVSTWHNEVPDVPTPVPGDPWWYSRIVDHRNKIASADALVLIGHGGTGGKFVEYGIALALGRKLYVLGTKPENGMTSSGQLIQKAGDL